MTDRATIIDLTNRLRHALAGVLDGNIPEPMMLAAEHGGAARVAAVHVVAAIDELEEVLLHAGSRKPTEAVALPT